MNNKPTFEFHLKVSDGEPEGFALRIKASKDEHVKTAQMLTEKLIEKIERIKITIGYERGEE